ncbi:MAG: hypothetical protein K1X61_12875 [Chitinophagales bacterium]|nr:hypothetical protein [Chitinophagales bacterium]
MKKILLFQSMILLFYSCSNVSTQKPAPAGTASVQQVNEKPLVEKVLTKEEQAALTQDSVL